MKVLRTFFISYFFVSFVVSFASVLVPFYPGTEAISWFLETDGKFPLLQVVGVVFLMFLLPVLILFFFISKVLAARSEKQSELIDQARIEIKRERALYAGMYGIEIYVNEKKKGSVGNGGSTQISLPYGEQMVFASAMGITTEPVSVVVSDQPIVLVTGYELVDGKQRPFLKEA